MMAECFQDGSTASPHVMALPLVSIYLPTRNRRDLLERAVNSVLCQDYAALELIVVNDGSTDATGAFLDDLAARDDRVRVIHHARGGGAPAARNEAIRLSRGAFITGLDDDDFFARDRIESFVEAWHELERQSKRPACLYSQTVELRDGRKGISTRPDAVTFADMFVQNLIGNQIFAPRDVYMKAGLFDECLPAWQDLDLFIRVLQGNGEAFLVDKGTYIYDDYDRDDRISADASRVRRAFSIISQKHKSRYVRAEFDLFMQMFNGYYDVYPSWSDFTYAFGAGANFSQFTALAKMAIKSVLKANVRFKIAAR